MNTTELKFSALSLASYTISKVTGLATVNLRETWHFQALQEIAFLAAIFSAAIALLSFHRNIRKDKKKNGNKEV